MTRYLWILISQVVMAVLSYRAVIHIGPHKTGSSELQMELLHYKKSLKDQGYHFLTGSHPKLGATFANTLAERTNYTAHYKPQIYNEMLRVIRNCTSHIILSSEDFAPFNAQKITELKEIFSCYEEISIVAVLRLSLARWRSYWCEFNKKSYNKDFISCSKYFQIVKENNNTFESFNFLEMLDKYAKVFSPQNIKLISFEGAIKRYTGRSDALFLSFMEVIGLPMSPSMHPVTKMIANQSPGIMEISFCQERHKLGFDVGSISNCLTDAKKYKSILPICNTTLFPSDGILLQDLLASNRYKVFYALDAAAHNASLMFSYFCFYTSNLQFN